LEFDVAVSGKSLEFKLSQSENYPVAPPPKKMLEIFNVHETILRTTVQNFFCLLPSAAFVSSVLSWKALLQLVWKTYLKVFEKSNRQHYHIDDCLEDNREDC